MPFIVIAGLIIWFIVAFTLGALGMVATLHPPLPQIVLVVLVTLLFVLLAVWRDLRQWIFTIPIQRLMCVHLVRFVGIYFLILYSQGQLPFAFAVPGGIGDTFIAITALLVLFVHSRRVLIIWNVLGLLDIFMVVVTAAREGMAHSESMTALLRLPLSLLPTFFVPLIIFTHIVMIARLVQMKMIHSPRKPAY